ncbi:MAG: hypothetical protein FWE42_07750 [Defluviitaleaceae bacterium]|nr:hypothetical protein [Defluviitaleaceae bacterium]
MLDIIITSLTIIIGVFTFLTISLITKQIFDIKKASADIGVLESNVVNITTTMEQLKEVLKNIDTSQLKGLDKSDLNTDAMLSDALIALKQLESQQNKEK